MTFDDLRTMWQQAQDLEATCERINRDEALPWYQRGLLHDAQVHFYKAADCLMAVMERAFPHDVTVWDV